MTNKTALVDAGHVMDAYRAWQVGTVVCVRSFACQDADTGEVFTYTAGQSYVEASSDVAVQFPENFAPDGIGDDARNTAPTNDVELRSDPPPAPDVRGLLVCVKGFSFEDPDTGLLRYVRYGHDYAEPGGWLDEHYGEYFVRVEEVVPSDRIPHLPLRDDE